jgi:hypothetical protein
VNLVVLYKKDGAFFYRYAEANLYKALLATLEMFSIAIFFTLVITGAILLL